MIGVQDQQHVEGLSDCRVDLVRLGGPPKCHPHKAVDQTVVVVRVQQRLPQRLPQRIRRNCRDLCQQTNRRDVDLFRIKRVERILVESRQCADRTRQDRHGMCIRGEPIKEVLEVLVQECVNPQLRFKCRQLAWRRQRTVDQQVCDLDKRGLCGELFDRIPAVAQDPLVTVDVRDRRCARSGVHKPVVQGDRASCGQQL